VEPGVILGALNRAAAAHGLTFGPDPASAERATLGGVIANNATGAHSILYGMAADHILSADVIMADGSLATLGEIETTDPASLVSDTLISKFTAAALRIRGQNAEAIRARYPRTWRNSAGYRLNYLLPWSPSQPPQWASSQSGGIDQYPPATPERINMATLLAGSEGTLAVMQRITLSLVPRPRHTVLAVLDYPSVEKRATMSPDY
jgi:FAD/FMN-containing dehydrogenase